MRLVFGHDQQVAAFVASRIPHMGAAFSGQYAAIGVAHRDILLGGVVYTDYVPAYGSIQMHCGAIDNRWLIGPPGDRKAIIRGLLAYPFAQLKVQRVTCVMPKRCKAARRFNEKLGFRREGLVRKGFGADDAVISGMLASEWAAGPWAAAHG